jgi:hypothetical protein
LTAGLALWLGLNPDLCILIVIPTNGVREEESAGLDKADSFAKYRRRNDGRSFTVMWQGF